jgi:hypothetical protein
MSQSSTKGRQAIRDIMLADMSLVDLQVYVAVFGWNNCWIEIVIRSTLHSLFLVQKELHIVIRLNSNFALVIKYNGNKYRRIAMI